MNLNDNLTHQRFLKSPEFRNFCQLIPFFIARTHARFPDDIGDVGLSYMLDRNPGLIVSPQGDIAQEQWDALAQAMRDQVQQEGLQSLLEKPLHNQLPGKPGSAIFSWVIEDVRHAQELLLTFLQGGASPAQEMRNYLEDSTPQTAFSFTNTYAHEAARLCANVAREKGLGTATSLLLEAISPLDGPCFAKAVDMFVFDLAAANPAYLEGQGLNRELLEALEKQAQESEVLREGQKDLVNAVLTQPLPRQAVAILTQELLQGSTLAAPAKSEAFRL